MKTTKLIIAIIVALLGASSLRAQSVADAAGSVFNGELPKQTTSYTGLDYDGLMFQVPQGMQVTRAANLTALYPDGTFGITMMTHDIHSTKGIAHKLCKRLADSLGLPRSLVKKKDYGSAKGAQAQGMIDGMLVTCIVLVIDEHQVEITVMADPSRKDWLTHFLNTLRR